MEVGLNRRFTTEAEKKVLDELLAADVPEDRIKQWYQAADGRMELIMHYFKHSEWY